MLYFITANADKFREARSFIPDILQLSLDLPEIQEIDVKKIIKAKLEAARAHKEGDFIVEDTGLYLEGLHGLPGPLVKWFLKALGPEGIYNLVKDRDNPAFAKTMIGYAKQGEEIHFFEGILRGAIVEPQGAGGFGWDSIFKPEKNNKTFAEMTEQEKNQVSMRREAFVQLKEFLNM